MKRLSLAALCAGLVLMAVTAFAEPGPRSHDRSCRRGHGIRQGPGRGGPPSEAKREQVRKKVEAIRMWRLTEELKLDEKTSTQLASFLSSIEEKRRGLIKTTMEATRDLRTSSMRQSPMKDGSRRPSTRSRRASGS